MNVINQQLTPQEKEEKIKVILDFHKKNKNIPAIFKMQGIFNHLHELTNNKSKDISGTTFSIPNPIDIDTERNGEAVRETIFWHGGNDIFLASKKFLDANGEFKRPNNAKTIFGHSNMIATKADSVEAERLIQYLLYMSFFFGNGTYLRYDDGALVRPAKKVSAEDKEALFNIINKLSGTKEGFDYLISLNGTGVFVKDTDIINAILSRENGKSDYVSFIKNKVDSSFTDMKETILPFKEVKELYDNAKKTGIIAYNKETKSYQIKGADGKFIADSTIIITEEKDKDILDILLLSEIKKDEKIKNNLRLILKDK